MKIKSKRLLCWCLALVLAVGIIPLSTWAAAPAQDANQVYQIGTADELLWFAQTVNGGKTSISAVLTKDIDLSGVNWPGIGSYDQRFAGSFNGKGHTVTFDNSHWGLFGYVKGTENNCVQISNVITAGSVELSAMVHNAAYTYVTGCINRATVSSTDSNVAGIVGHVSGEYKAGYLYTDVQITNCGNEASISGGNYVGGILGYADSNTRINGCYNTGTIHGSDNVGGVAGYLQESRGTCDIRNSYNLGRITGASNVAGIIGNMYNGVSVVNCYNAGYATYAIAGYLYNNTATIQNCYFQGTKSAKGAPDYVYTDSAEITSRATAKSAAEMITAEFAAALGSEFKQSCPAPVLSWQTAAGHNGSPCAVCGYGSTAKEEYDVSFPTHAGYSFTGDAKAVQGEAYTFSITISDGYETNSKFAVKVNGTVVNPASNGKYTVLNVSGPLSVTVTGVQVIPGSYAVRLPAEGYGYRVSGAATVKRNENYTFTISFVDGFRAGSNFKVIAQEVVAEGQTPAELELTANSKGVYTISNVTKEYRILVSGVEAVSKGVKATVDFSITEGYNHFHESPNSEELMLDQTFTVPYFDLSLYGLERYYYNPYCYVDEAGNIRGIQQKGTPESAYDNITLMHAFIVATELYYLEYSPAQVGKGLSYARDPEGFKKAISWSQDAGSSFMDFWDHGTNLNYYVNYEYPLAYPGWGSTSDQILIQNGDVISAHMITGSASGSRFGFFTVNDTDKKYTAADTIDEFTVDQGEKINLTLYWTSTTGNYDTGYELMANQKLYWISADEVESDVRDWNSKNFGKTAELVTDSKGTVSVSTAGVEPGIYYIASLGGFTTGGAVDNSGFQSAGGETGPAVFKLTVNEYEGKLGDVNGDTMINATDANVILRYVAKLTADVNDAVADVNGDGVINATDANVILRYVAKLIDSFPAENK